MAAPMSDRTNHRRVLHFAVTGVLLGGAVGCESNEPAKADTKAKTETKGVEQPKPEPEPEVKFAPNPGPNELKGIQPPEVAPTTAVPPPEPIEDDHVNEGPVDEPEPVGINEGPKPEPKPNPKLEEKRVNTQPVKEPLPEPKPQIKVNPGPADRQ
jgi:hypothetical protein